MWIGVKWMYSSFNWPCSRLTYATNISRGSPDENASKKVGRKLASALAVKFVVLQIYMWIYIVLTMKSSRTLVQRPERRHDYVASMLSAQKHWSAASKRFLVWKLPHGAYKPVEKPAYCLHRRYHLFSTLCFPQTILPAFCLNCITILYNGDNHYTYRRTRRVLVYCYFII